MKTCLNIYLIIASSASFAVAQPKTFDQIVVFGDSLSDVGNLHSDRPHVAAPDPPYFEGRFSNGPNWVDRLAEHLRAERPLASELGGKNYAWAAATARVDLNWFIDLEPDFSVPSIPDQVAEFFEDGGPQGNQLFVVWAGHNDIWPKYGDDRDVEKSVNGLTSQLTQLLDAGIQHLLVPNLTIHERIGPEIVPDFNSKLAARIAELRVAYPSATIYEFDHSAFMNAIVADPAMFGITEPIAPACLDCWGGPGENIVANPDEHFFWDRHHISAKGNQLLADAVYRQFFAVPALLAGDSDQDLDFDQLDLVQVQIAAKYLTGQAATWGDGDWNGAPGGGAGSPPAGDGLFNQFDVIAAQQAGTYLTGPYAAVRSGGEENDSQTSVVYNAGTGEIAVDAPEGTELTSFNIDSAAGVFTGNAAVNLGGSFDNDADTNIFKATFGSSFGSVSFGEVAQTGLSEEFVLGDLRVVGSLAVGGDLGNVDLVYVPQPGSVLLLSVGLAIGLLHLRRVNR